MSLSKPLLLTASCVWSCAVHTAEPPVFPGERLAKGRAVWIENCEGCHGYGVAGAPVATDAPEWQQRVAKGRTALYQHALEGFFGPRGTMMPPRGGNQSLSDDQVTAAVDYMLRLATATTFP